MFFSIIISLSYYFLTSDFLSLINKPLFVPLIILEKLEKLNGWFQRYRAYHGT